MIDAPVPGQQYKVNSILDLSPSALGELRSWLEGSGFQLPISQVVGFQLFTAKEATPILTEETRSSATYGNLATVGPTINELSAGKYVVFLGAAILNDSNNGSSYMSVSINGSTASDDDAIALTQYEVESPLRASLSRAILVTLTAASNTLQAKYKGDGTNTGYFSNRWMIALKYANA